jgi:tight adherence protein C
MMEYIWMGLVFVVLAAAILGGYAWFTRRERWSRRAWNAHECLSDSDDDIGSDRAASAVPSSPELPLLSTTSPVMMLGNATPTLAFPMGEEDQSDLQRELRAAGYYRKGAMMDFLAIRTLLVAAPLLAAGLLALFAVESSDALLILGAGVMLGMMGYAVPRLVLRSQGSTRALAIERGLPSAIDMLTLCLSSGQNVLNSLLRVSKEIGRAFPVLAEELQIVHRQADLRTLDFALAQFADRISLPHLRNLAVILSQSEHLGTDAVSILREYADNMRINQKQRVEEMANRAPFRLLFPAYLMAIGAAILILAPAVMELTDFRHNNMLGGVRATMPSDLKRGAAEVPTPDGNGKSTQQTLSARE